MKCLIKELIWKIISRNGKSFHISTPFKFIVKCCPKGTDVTYQKYLGKYSILIDNNKFIETQVVHKGYENDTVPIIQHFLKKGDVAIDFGANAGLISIVMADSVGKNGKVYSVEPGPVFFKRLRTNIESNHTLKNTFTLINKGVSNRNGALYWKEDENQPGNAILTSKELSKYP